jgi:hypothetical protein
MKLKKILVGVCVWGREYCEIFTKLALPSLLATGNIPYLANQFEVEFHITTSDVDRDYLINQQVICDLQKIIKVTFYPLPVSEKLSDITIGEVKNKYNLMNQCHAQLIQEAAKRDAGIIFIYPDSIYSRNSFVFVAEAINAGKRAVVSGDYMAEQEKLIPLLLTRSDEWMSKKNSALEIPARQLVELALNSCHPLFEQHCIESTEFSPYPNRIIWHSNMRKAAIVHAFHQTPIFVYPNNFNIPKNSIDNDFIQYALDNFNECIFSRNSDEFCCIEMSPRNKPRWSRGYRVANSQYVGSWMMNPYNKQNEFNRLAFTKSKLYISEEYALDFQVIETLADEFMSNTYRYAQMVLEGRAPFINPMYEDPKSRSDDSLAPPPQDAAEIALLRWSPNL